LVSRTGAEKKTEVETMKIKSKDYRDYVIKNGKFIGAFEEMYQNVEDPWHVGNATQIQYDIGLYLLKKRDVCSEGGNVLDVGCGLGAFTARLKEQMPKAEIIGVDIAPTAIEKARKRYGNLGIEFKALDIQKEYTRIENRFDLIVLSQLMWYVLPDFKKIVDYIGERCLTENGYVLVNQAFYKSEEQKYGKEIVSTVEDMLNLVDLEVVDMVEINRLTNHNAIILFRKQVNPTPPQTTR
jgi:SAM-dependent methyltransferase